MKSRLFIMLSFLAIAFFFMAFTASDLGDPWTVPEKFKSMKNPVKADKASIAAGLALWGKHCKSCHGKEGLGDGPKAATLKTNSGDFTSKAFKAQTDGSLYYKTTEGRDDMPSFKKKIPDAEDIWHLVNYMRTLK